MSFIGEELRIFASGMACIGHDASIDRLLQMIDQSTDILADHGVIYEVPQDKWDALVARLGADDAYLRYGWHAASAHLEQGEARPVLLHAKIEPSGNEVALGLLVRPLPQAEQGFDATSCYGYGGPIASSSFDSDVFAQLLDRWAHQSGVVATFLRMHPVLKNHIFAPANAQVTKLGSTVLWDTSSGRDLMAEMHSHHRRAVRKSERAGITCRVTVDPADLSGFRAMYDHTMRRQQAEPFYFFRDDYWESLLVEGGGGNIVTIEALLDSEPIAALLCVAHGEYLHYHLGASLDAARSVGASNACFLAGAQWAQEQGMSGFHLGGGVGGGSDSPLFTFKHRYDPTSEPRAFHIAKIVHDIDRYRELTGSESTEGFFPPWRERE